MTKEEKVKEILEMMEKEMNRLFVEVQEEITDRYIDKCHEEGTILNVLHSRLFQLGYETCPKLSIRHYNWEEVNQEMFKVPEE